MKRFIKLTAGAALLLLMLSSAVISQEKDIKAKLPVLITSIGQSPGPVSLKLFLEKRVNIKPIMKELVTAEELAEMKKSGNAIGTLMMVTGASLKGMGGAGVDIDSELKRAKALIAEAKKQGIIIIGSHIEGMARRAQGAAEGDNSDEMSIDAVCPFSDILLIKKAGNEDGRFTTISKDKNIPMIEFEKNFELTDILKKLFNK